MTYNYSNLIIEEDYKEILKIETDNGVTNIINKVKNNIIVNDNVNDNLINNVTNNTFNYSNILSNKDNENDNCSNDNCCDNNCINNNCSKNKDIVNNNIFNYSNILLNEDIDLVEEEKKDKINKKCGKNKIHKNKQLISKVDNNNNNLFSLFNSSSKETIINPFEFFGVNLKSSIKELKKIYYTMALIVHPDRGGSEEEMNILANAYKYVKEQLQHKNDDINNKSLEELEEKFYDFCKKQEKIPMPKFSDIYEETNDWIHEFNKEFEKDSSKSSKKNIYNNNQFGINSGYGDLMDKSDINQEIINNECGNIKYDNVREKIKKTKNQFSREIINYTGEDTYKNQGIGSNAFDITGKKIKDFSGNKCYETDYMIAFSNPEEIKDNRNFNKSNNQVMLEYEKMLIDRKINN